MRAGKDFASGPGVLRDLAFGDSGLRCESGPRVFASRTTGARKPSSFIFAMLSRAPKFRLRLDFGLLAALPIGQDGGAPWTVSGSKAKNITSCSPA